jgi:hypothetical protein
VALARAYLTDQPPAKLDEELIAWLEATVAGWNQAPSPFIWDGKRCERRERAWQRRLGGSGTSLADPLLSAA